MRLFPRLRALCAAALPTLLLGAAAACNNDTRVTDPNRLTAATFWKSQGDALQGLTAAYAGMAQNGVYGRWWGFATDIRSDIGYSNSPWTDLQNWNKFIVGTYDFEPNASLYFDHYSTINRANQVIAYVPAIDMDAATKTRVIGEAKFIRALMYYELLQYYGPNIPFSTAPSQVGDNPPAPGAAVIYAQVQTDLADAIKALPAAYTGADVGRATNGAAQALLGRVLLQQRKWADASAQLDAVIKSGRYTLDTDYGRNFTAAGKNNSESLFEIQFSDRTQLAAGVRGLNVAKLIGACGPTFCDGQPTTWYFNLFLRDSTTDGKLDPRLDATMFWHPDSLVFGRKFRDRYADRLSDPKRIAAGDSVLFFKKYSEYYVAGDQDWDAPLNYKVIRYADVLLMQAEALNEQGNTAAAYPLVNQVRARVRLKPLAAGLGQAGMRAALLDERARELGFEGVRFNDLLRQNMFTDAASLAALKTHDREFSLFTLPKGMYLPIPTAETNLNPNVKQNPGW